MYFREFPTIDYDIEGTGAYVTVPSLATMAAVSTKVQDQVSFYSYYNVADGDRPDNVSQKLYGTPKYYWTFFLINPELNNYYDDWPKGTSQLRAWVRDKYDNTVGITTGDEIAGKFHLGETIRGSLSGATATLVAKHPSMGYIEMVDPVGTFYETESLYGLQSQDSIGANVTIKMNAPHHHIDNFTGEWTLRRDAGTTPVTFYEWERNADIERAKIRVIKPEHIRSVAAEFVREINK